MGHKRCAIWAFSAYEGQDKIGLSVYMNAEIKFGFWVFIAYLYEGRNTIGPSVYMKAEIQCTIGPSVHMKALV